MICAAFLAAGAGFTLTGRTPSVASRTSDISNSIAVFGASGGTGSEVSDSALATFPGAHVSFSHIGCVPACSSIAGGASGA